MIKIRNTINPITRLPPPTKRPKVLTTLPGSPVVKINFVVETFKEILNIVVNNKMVGKADIFKTSLVNIALNNITMESAILKASNTSRSIEGIGIIKNTIAANKYNPTAKSFLFISNPPVL